MLSLLLNLVALIHIGVWILIGVLFYCIYNGIWPAEKSLAELEPKWFGSGSRGDNEDKTVRDFKIEIGDEDIKDLKERLARDMKRLGDNHPVPLRGDFEYGCNSQFLVKEIGEYWLEEYNWKIQEELLNKMGSHHKTSIDGMDVHFVRVRPDQATEKKVIPLLMAHGWPGSFAEFIKIAPMLTKETDDKDYVFDLIIPSIPGYGFSDAPQQPGFNFGHAARIYKTLMVERLGITKFYTQAGDWGWAITASMGIMYPNHVKGSHFNMAFSSTPSSLLRLLAGALFPSLVFQPGELKYFNGSVFKTFKGLLNSSGYFHIQATRPDTIGAALNTSPIGLASYIIQMFAEYCTIGNKEFSGQKLLENFSKDELLTNVMIYWLTGTIQSSMRFYKENSGGIGDAHLKQLSRQPSYVPTAISMNQRDPLCHPKTILKGKLRNIVSYTEQPRGGHFLALEEPKLLAQDVVKFVNIVDGVAHGDQSKKEL